MGKKQIMIVDDEEDICSLVKTALEKEGYEVITANNADIAWKKLEKNPNVALIFLDIKMPGMPCKEFIEKIEGDKKYKNIKIAFLSAVTFPEKEKQEILKKEQVIDFIEKPFSVNDLIEKVKKV
jgi:CheY-like chemotaxis protein